MVKDRRTEILRNNNNNNKKEEEKNCDSIGSLGIVVHYKNFLGDPMLSNPLWNSFVSVASHYDFESFVYARQKCLFGGCESKTVFRNT